jgi:hypothetical protein
MKGKVFILFLILCFSGISVFGKSKLPYMIDAEMEIDDCAQYQIAGLNFNFWNKGKSKVREFTMVFCMYDEDGNPLALGKSNVVINVHALIDSGEFYEGTVSLDRFLLEMPEEPYQIDYLYVSRIVYDDDSVWTDPFGLQAF